MPTERSTNGLADERQQDIPREIPVYRNPVAGIRLAEGGRRRADGHDALQVQAFIFKGIERGVMLVTVGMIPRLRTKKGPIEMRRLFGFTWIILLVFVSFPWGAWCQVIKEPRPGWNVARSFAVGRSRHTLSLLPSGTVLLAGGFNDSDGSLATTRIYDPRTDEWSAADPLLTPRDSHSATLLPSGEVLVVGGRNWPTTAIQSAEIFDPVNACWQEAVQPGFARSMHTATLLPSGLVLVVGGSDAGALDASELYDPHHDTWRTITPLATARYGHTATLLPSGKVLVLGGLDESDEFIDAAELFDPATEAWSSVAADPIPRAFHSATLTNSGAVMVVGGDSASGVIGDVRLYDPGTNAWSQLDDLSYPRAHHTASLLPNGGVVVCGGYDGTEVVNRSEEYSPNHIWNEAAHQVAREWAAAVVLPSGEILLTGGYNDGDYGGHQASAELYDSYPYYTDESMPDSPTYREGGHTATLLASGLMMVVGGTTSISITAATELYDPATETWHAAAGPMGQARAYHSASLLFDGKVLVAGGSDGVTTIVGSELFDPSTETWVPVGNLAADRMDHTATVLPTGEVLVTGGYSTTANHLSSCEIYDPQTGLWRSTAPLAEARTKHTATLLPSGLVLVTGGFNATSGNLASSELFDPVTESWTEVASLNDFRSAHTASLLPNGKVLVAGGRGLAWELQSAELYDPESDVWAYTQNFEYRRQGHTATVLTSGDVIIHGGSGDWGDEVTQAEIFMRGTGLWLQDDYLNGSSGRTACRMLNSDVIFLGGGDNNPEVYYQRIDPEVQRPHIDNVPETVRFGEPFTLVGSGLRGGSESSGGYSTSSASNGPIVQLQSLENGYIAWLVPEPEADVFNDTLEGGLGCWTASGLLHLAVDSSCENPAYSSPFNSAYFGQESGCTYDTGSISTGELVSWPITGIESDSELHFDYLREVEYSTSERDLTTVEVSETGSPDWTTIWQRSSLDPSPATWQTNESVPLTSFAGDEIQLRFRFDTIDDQQNQQLGWMVDNIQIDGKSNCSGWFGSRSLTIDRLPATLNPGWYVLTVISAGVPSEPRVVMLECSISITKQPADQSGVPIGSSADFVIDTQGAKRFQWQACTTGQCLEANWVDIEGANSPSYSTPPVSGTDSGKKYRVIVSNGCTSAVSAPATLTVADDSPPVAEILYPTGGEFWLLSSDPPEPANVELISWAMADDVRICSLELALLCSTDGVSWPSEPSDPCYQVMAQMGPGGACVHPGVLTTTFGYEVPTTPPSGVPGSLYKVQLVVTDHAGNMTKVTSANPFYIVEPDPDSVDTLILANVGRMGATPTQTASLNLKLSELADHPRVRGLLVDLGGVTALEAPYAAFDAAVAASQGDPGNDILLDASTAAANELVAAIHEHLLSLLELYTGVEQLVLVGDDQIIPFARIPDDASLLPESTYTAGTDLPVAESSVAQALSSEHFLSDDPMATVASFGTSELGNRVFVPDLMVGRLVERPEEITSTIANYISADGVLDLSTLDADTGHKVLITGYDFLIDSAKQIRNRWKQQLGISTPDGSLEPVDASLISSTWSEPDPETRADTLFSHLSGNSGVTYGIMNLNGHATHYQEGVPGTDPHNIVGLDAVQLFGDDGCGMSDGPLSFSGAVVYSVGCHSGLPVPGSCSTDSGHSLDLPQTMMARGVQGYLGNTGYGWGLVHGIGYGERLVEIFSEEITRGGTVTMGDLIRDSKRRYVLESPRFDAYDVKTLMQWTLYGLPMYAVKTGIPEGGTKRFEGAPPLPEQIPGTMSVGLAKLSQRVADEETTTIPPYVTRLEQHWDFSAEGVYQKRTAMGEVVTATVSGCPDPEGCYYTLNDLVERGSGSTDLPIQPYFVFDSRMSGTSQHGVLWKGGVYDEEDGWVPVIAELASNGGDASNHGSTARKAISRPTGTRIMGGSDPSACRPNDLELNGLVVTTAEAVKFYDTDPIFSIERLYRGLDIEVFYYNNTNDVVSNCDREGPLFGPGPYDGEYHHQTGDSLELAVPVSDTGGVWRVVVVATDNRVDADGQGRWEPFELEDDGTGTWRTPELIDLSGIERYTYLIQAVDRRGNVSWLEYNALELPASGVDPTLPLPVDVGEPSLFSDDFESGDTTKWSAQEP